MTTLLASVERSSPSSLSVPTALRKLNTVIVWTLYIKSTNQSVNQPIMKFTLLTTTAIMALTTLSASQTLPDATDSKIVPIRWNDVEAGVHAAQSSAVGKRDAAPEPGPEPEPRRHKSGAESGYRGGSGLWGRSPKTKKEKGKKPGKKIEEANVFDQGGDHKGDPSWG